VALATDGLQIEQVKADHKTAGPLIRGDESSGKTTLLRLLAGELTTQAGQLQIERINLAEQALTYRQQVFWIAPLRRSTRHRFVLS
jgi:ABC-type transport system involved in cytochrome c biogenesis ATPase subunit